MIPLQERVHGTARPIGWVLDKLHSTLNVRSGNRNTGMLEDNLLSLSYGRVVRKSIETDAGLLPESFETYQIVEPGDIVMRLTDLQNDKRSLRQGLVKERGIITSAYDALHVSCNNDPSFWAYALLALDLAKYYYSLGGGVRQSVKFSDFPNELIYRPDLPTQKRIASFLDRETARIDGLIAKKERLSDVLLSQEENVLRRMISDCTAVPWRVRHLGKLKNGAGFPVELQGDAGNAIPFFKVKHLKTYGLDAEILNSDDTVSRDTARKLGATVFPSGTIVFAKIGAALLLARFSKIGVDACLDNNLSAFIPRKNIIIPDFAILAFSQIDMETMVQPGAVPSMNTESFYNYRIPLPDLAGQEAFVAEFRRFRNRLQATALKVRVSLDLLREYRAALITAAVTGQIDVETYGKAGATSAALDRIEEMTA